MMKTFQSHILRFDQKNYFLKLFFILFSIVFSILLSLFFCFLYFSLSNSAFAQSNEKEADNGTDPTRFSRTMGFQYEYKNINHGFRSEIVNLNYSEPLGKKQDYSLRLRVPITRINPMNPHDFNWGDASIKLSHLFALTKKYGVVGGAELVFDTAHRPELGTGKNVLKLNAIYARFLNDGDIFAPSIVHSRSFGGDEHRVIVNNTVFDFYYVPKLKTKDYFVTFDPSLTVDWESKKTFGNLAVTVGHPLGATLGGNSQIFMKPSVFIGSEKPAHWGMEMGFKLIGF